MEHTYVEHAVILTFFVIQSFIMGATKLSNGEQGYSNPLLRCLFVIKYFIYKYKVYQKKI